MAEQEREVAQGDFSRLFAPAGTVEVAGLAETLNRSVATSGTPAGERGDERDPAATTSFTPQGRRYTAGRGRRLGLCVVGRHHFVRGVDPLHARRHHGPATAAVLRKTSSTLTDMKAWVCTAGQFGIKWLMPMYFLSNVF